MSNSNCSLLVYRKEIDGHMLTLWISLVVQQIKNLPAMQENWIQFLGWEDLLQKEMGTHSSILAWRISRTEESGELQSTGSQKSWTRLSD